MSRSMNPCALFLLASLAAYSADLRQGTFRGHAVTYRVIDGFAVAEGDMLLGPAGDPALDAPRAPARTNAAAAIASTAFRWTDRVIPYEVDPAVPGAQRITEAVRQWNDRAPVRLMPRTGQSNYVRFVRATSGCTSFVGMVGGAQPINLADTCDIPSVIHEIGHAAGLYHEHSRQDRDLYLRFFPQNVDKIELAQYEQPLRTGRDLGGYDYGSIMHYGVLAFSRNERPALETIPAGIPIGGQTALSAGDLDALRRLYGVAPEGFTVTTHPAGLAFTVDGVSYMSAQMFRWEPGSRHTLSVPEQQTPTGNLRMQFARWNNGGDREQTIVAGEDFTVYVANYARWYRMQSGVLPTPAAGSIRFNPSPEDGFYLEGSPLELTAVPGDGFSLLGWTGFGFFGLHGISPNPVRFVVQPQLEYIAQFVQGAVTTVASDPPGRRLIVDGTAFAAPRNFAWPAGTQHDLEAPPGQQVARTTAARFIFERWSNTTDSRQTVIAGSSANTYTAVFQVEHQVATQVRPSGAGRVNLSPSSVDGYYREGTVLQATADPTAGFAFAGWSGDLAGAAGSPASFTVSDQGLIGASFVVPGQIAAGGIVHAATFQSGSVSPGQLVTIFGLGFGPTELTTLRLNSAGRVETTLAGTRVLFDGVAAPLVYVSPNQIAAVAPYQIAARSTTSVQVEFQGRPSAAVSVPVAPSHPGLFAGNSAGSGLAAALNQDGSVHSQANPASRDSVIVLYATGEGATEPGGVDGQVAAPPLPRPVLPVQVTIGGRRAELLYAGAAPGLVSGVFQINARIPADCPLGLVPVVVTVGEASSPANTFVAVR